MTIITIPTNTTKASVELPRTSEDSYKDVGRFLLIGNDHEAADLRQPLAQELFTRLGFNRFDLDTERPQSAYVYTHGNRFNHTRVDRRALTGLDSDPKFWGCISAIVTAWNNEFEMLVKDPTIDTDPDMRRRQIEQAVDLLYDARDVTNIIFDQFLLSVSGKPLM